MPAGSIYHTAFRAMGCSVAIQLQANVDVTPVLTRLPARFDLLEDILSRFRPDSELSRLNRKTGEWVEVSAILYATIQLAKHAAWRTNGLFNPLILPAMRSIGYDRTFTALVDVQASGDFVPAVDWQQIDFRRREHRVYLPPGGEIDLGGIAKGWTAGVIADELSSYGAVLVSIGGDIVAVGAPNDQSGWQIDIIDPCSDDASPQRAVARLTLRDRAVVTSGIDFRRWLSRGSQYHHIIDPRTGCSAQTDVIAATIIHPAVEHAEAYAKAVLLLGSQQGLEWLRRQSSHEETAGLVVRRDGSVMATDTLLDYVEPSFNISGNHLL